MKYLRNTIILRPGLIFSIILSVCFFNCSPSGSELKAETGTIKKDETEKVTDNRADAGQNKSKAKQSIMLALLLDTSNSMDGLIDQAKSQLWTIVNELAAAKCDDGDRPEIKIALYEYGNDNLPSSENYIRMVSPLTDDLDEISNKLFALTTCGGDEFCGAVIKKSLDQLDWSKSDADLKMIFIAGNEPFTQGNISYRSICQLAKEKDLVINTIFCGNYEEGVSTMWKNGADITNGTYMSIEQNKKTVYIPSPYDDQIDKLNTQLNETYVYYGKSGVSKKEMQLKQDDNAQSLSQQNKINRAVSKSSHAYKNSSWDLVDACKDDEKAIEKVDEEYLPKELKGKTTEEKKQYVKQKTAERADIQKQIADLNVKRQDYISKNTPKEDSDDMLDKAMIKSVKEKAATKKLTFK